MEVSEHDVQKYMINFCKILPFHVEKWRSINQRSEIPVRNLTNLSEQLRCVEKAKLIGLHDFENVQKTLLYQIESRAEEEMLILKGLVDELHTLNNELRNKLIILDKSTLNLDWEHGSLLIKGNGLRPSLPRLLQGGLEFVNFFSKSAKEISDSLKLIDIKNCKSVKRLEMVRCIDLDSPIVNYFIALTQYVNNEQAIL